ncbi:MAG: hypothetical protein ABSG86_07355 [Thermoguttaceae bacterium]|jgi:Leucine-rich repeat (LRR) protein
MDNTPQPNRRWFQSSLRWPLLLALLLSILCGWFAVKMEQAGKQKAVVEEIENLGGLVWRDYQFDADGVPITKDPQPPGPAWLRRLLGDDFFMNVTKLDLTQTAVTDAGLEHLKGLTQLQSLYLGSEVTDAGLEHLKDFTQLRTLNLRATAVTDAGLEHLKGFAQLQSLCLGAKVTDAGLEHLKGLRQLQSLDLSGTRVTDAGLEHLEGLPHLQSLHLGLTRVSDAGLDRIKGLTELHYLDLSRTNVTDAGVERLQRALPKCTIQHH